MRFAPASGRQFYTLYEQFGEIADELMYISENGSMVCDGAKCVGFSALPAEVVLEAVERVRATPDVYTVVSAQSGAFYEPARPKRRCATSICTAHAAPRCPTLWNL